MKYAIALLSSLLVAAPAFGHGVPIDISVVNGKIMTASKVYSSTLDPLANILYQTDLPGIGVASAGNKVPSGKSFSFNVVDQLLYWSGGSLTNSNQTFGIQNDLGDGVDVTKDTIFETGVTIGAYNGNPGWHAHPFYSVPFSAPVGVYGIVMTLTAPGLERSDPLLLVFNRGDSTGDVATATAAMTTYAFPTPGDANRDGKVTGADYTLWAANFQKVGNFGRGDFNYDGKVTGADYTIWAANFQTGAAAAAVVVPEPAGLLLALAGLVALGARHRHARRKTPAPQRALRSIPSRPMSSFISSHTSFLAPGLRNKYEGW